MKFRTIIETPRSKCKIEPTTPIILLGSCFADNIGSRLIRDGFTTIVNPLGPLYNPMSLAECLRRALQELKYSPFDMIEDERGFHCLGYASRYTDNDAWKLADTVNKDIQIVKNHLNKGGLLFVTFGTSWIFEWRENRSLVVGNCHKFPADAFERRRLSVAEIVRRWEGSLKKLAQMGIHTVFTVSPTRHLADGLHGNTLSKAVLQLAIDELCAKFPETTEYFPAFEILNDDLRDYRFYADDLKHPSSFAADYVYEIFEKSFFSPEACLYADTSRRQALRDAHRQILPN